MKVLYVLKRFPRLSETFILREMLGLEAAGDELLIDALLFPEDEPRHPELASLAAPVRYINRRPKLRDPDVLAAHRAVALRHPMIWLHLAARAHVRRKRGQPDAWRRFLQAGVVAEGAKRNGVDHVHAHFATAAAEVASDAGRLAGIVVTVTAHAKDIYQQDNVGRLAQRLGDIQSVVTMSQYNVAHLRGVLGPTTSVHHVPNGVSLGEPHGPNVGGPLLCVSRLVPKKAIDVLIEAVALLTPEHPTLSVEIIGDGPLRSELAQLAADRGVADRVLFRGPLPYDEVRAAYRRAAAVVLPCRVALDGDRDGLPTVLVEAAACALPVVSSDVVGISELVEHEHTGLLVAPEDPTALSVALKRLLEDPALGTALGRAARCAVAERYDPDVATSRLRSVFLERNSK